MARGATVSLATACALVAAGEGCGAIFGIDVMPLRDDGGVAEAAGADVVGPVDVQEATVEASGGDVASEANETGTPGALLSVMSFGGAGDDSATGVVFDASGNAYVIGHLGSPSALVGSTSIPVAGADSAVVVKVDPKGNVLWARSPTPAAGQECDGRGIAINARGNIVVGVDFGGTITWGGQSFVSAGGLDAALFELDPDGNVVGGQRYGSTYDEQTEAVAKLPGGGVALSGRFRCVGNVGPCTTNLGGATLSNQGGYDAFLLIVDASYAHVYSTAWGGLQEDDVNSMVSDSAGVLYLCGAISGTPTVGGKTLTTKGGMDVLFASFTSSGALVQAQTFGSAAADTGQGIALLPGGDVVLAGYIGGRVDFGGGLIGAPSATEGFAARVSPSGAYTWAEAFGGAGSLVEALGYTIGVGPTGHIALPLVFDGTVNFGFGPVTSESDDALILSLDAQGTPLWSWRLGGPGFDQANATAVDSTGNTMMVGVFQASASIGTSYITSNGGWDGFLATFGP
jgi:hypothetical protein